MTEIMAQFGFFVLIGGGIELIYLTAPIHELGHWLMALMIGRYATYGFRGIRMSWAGLSGSEVMAMAYSGVVFEVGVCLILAILFSKKHHLLAGTFFGVSLSAYLTTATLTDMSLVNGVGLGLYYILGFIALCIGFLTIAYRIDHSGLSAKVA